MEPEVERRIAHNESAFRDVNETLKRGHWPGDEAHPIAFRCECGELGCSRILELAGEDYERIRAHPRRFLVAPDHEVPEVETVVERHAHYVVVEKTDAAGREAGRADPRS